MQHRAKPGGRRTLLLIVAIGLAPIVASYAAYYWLTPSKRLNYGELLETAPAPVVAGTGADGKAFSLTDLRGKWVLLIASRGGCADDCARTLYATRQARTIQGREQDRVVRLLLQPSSASALPQELAISCRSAQLPPPASCCSTRAATWCCAMAPTRISGGSPTICSGSSRHRRSGERRW